MGNPTAMRDKVAIIGMGCTKFGENFEWSAEDMIIDATFEALEDAGVELKDIEAGFIAVTTSGATGCMMAIPLKMGPIPITRVENGCSSGIDAIRVGAMSIACGLYDLVLCVGVEKLKDSGFSGLPEYFFDPVYGQGATAPGRWAMGATRYFSHYGLKPEEGKRALAQIAVKNHANGVKSPKAHFRRAITLDQALNAPIIAFPLGLFDCCAVTDGAAACILCPADMAKIDDDGLLLIITKWPEMQNMNVGATQITDAGLKHLRNVQSLRSLYVSLTDITDEGTKELAALQGVATLSLRGTRVTDQTVRHLKAMTNLTKVDLADTQVTAAGVAELQAALPNCKMITGSDEDDDFDPRAN